jgi:hypothetical protein
METEKITETSHLILSKDNLSLVPACKGGIMESLRFSKFLKPWDRENRMFEYQGLVSTQPKTRPVKPELWLVKEEDFYSKIFASFKKRLLSGCVLAWKSQWQIEKFCEQNPAVLKKYHQGVYFLISRCESDDLYIVRVEQNCNKKKFEPMFSTFSIHFGSGVDSRNHGESKDFHCFILPATWRKVPKEIADY